MAAVSVFVDDAVRGRLPLVCAKTGEPADLVIRIRQPVGNGRSLLPLLLLLLGPIGLVLLLVHSILSPGQEYLTVRIPQTEAAYNREKQLERFRVVALVVGTLAVLYGIMAPGLFPALWLTIGAAFLVAGVTLHVLLCRQSISVSLDGSRRWVTLFGVHPAFVRAVSADEAVGRLGARR